jgi:hypothetical protein
MEWRCRHCAGLLASVGAAWCRCDGYIRWLRYPGMRNHNYKKVGDDYITVHVAIKPSKARRFQGGKHHSTRR